MSPNRFNIVGGKAFALIQISNIFFVFSYKRMSPRQIDHNQVSFRCNNEKYREEQQRKLWTPEGQWPRHVIYDWCAMLVLNPPVREEEDGYGGET